MSMLRRLAEVPRLLLIGLLLVLVALLRARPRRLRAGTGRLARVATVGALLCALASGTIAFAAGQQQTKPAQKPAAAPAAPAILVVPDVQGQAYVFAKGMLEDAGFAWRVTGDVGGYAANSVALQTPAAGTRVFDTGAPVVTLELARNSAYLEEGTPENRSPHAATPIESAGGGSSTAQAARPPAFEVSGAPKESVDQPSLPERAERLAAWVETHPTPSRANRRHWRYEHRWILTGATFGWWGGAEALETLVRVDRRVEALWGIGSHRRTAAKRALTEVRERSR